MNEPIIGKFPTEVFGCPYAGQNEKLKSALKQQYCKYVKSTCIKPRKSEPHIKVGICSLGYKCGFIDKHIPIIVCPQHFKEEFIKNIIKKGIFDGVLKKED